MNKPIRWNTDAKPISEMPSFAAKSAFWRELKAAASEHLAAEANAGQPSVGDPRLQLKAAIIVIWFGLSYAALLCAPSLLTIRGCGRSSARSRSATDCPAMIWVASYRLSNSISHCSRRSELRAETTRSPLATAAICNAVHWSEYANL